MLCDAAGMADARRRAAAAMAQLGPPTPAASAQRRVPGFALVSGDDLLSALVAEAGPRGCGQLPQQRCGRVRLGTRHGEGEHLRFGERHCRAGIQDQVPRRAQLRSQAQGHPPAFAGPGSLPRRP